jgi:hypothetical protein
LIFSLSAALFCQCASSIVVRLPCRPDDLVSYQVSDQEDHCQYLSGFGLRLLQRNDATCGTKIAEEVIQRRLGKEIVKGQEIAAG